jgi:hypothetical protein
MPHEGPVSPGRQTPPEQHPFGHEVPSHTQVLPMQRCPGAQATSAPHRHTPAAEQLSAREVQAGASGQISVMVWPDTVAVPREPPTTETDASMRTQAAGIFINPKLNVKHLIRFKDGQTVSERDFGRKVQ